MLEKIDLGAARGQSINFLLCLARPSDTGTKYWYVGDRASPRGAPAVALIPHAGRASTHQRSMTQIARPELSDEELKAKWSRPRAEIEARFARGLRASPCTRAPLAHCELIPNHALRDAIAQLDQTGAP